MSKPPLDVLGRNCEQRLLKRFDQIRKGTRFELTQLCLDFRPRPFNWIEIRRVGWQIDQVRPTRLDQSVKSGDLVGWEIVHEQDVIALERRQHTLRKVPIEDGAIDCPRQD